MVDLISIVKELPYNRLLGMKEAIKMSFWTVNWPDSPSVHIDEDPEVLEARLRGWGFEGVYLSYNYEGQVLDLRRPEGTDLNRQMELHIRAREHPDEDGLEVVAHMELSRYEHKRDHINAVDLRWLEEEKLHQVLSGDRINENGGYVEMGW